MRWGLPVGPLGISSRKTMRRGTLKSARVWAAKSRRAASAMEEPGWRTTAAAMSSPRRASGMAKARAWVAEEGFIDFARSDFFASAVDHLLGAGAEGEVAVGVKRADVAGAEPAVAVGFGVGLGVVFVAGCDVVAADDDFA